MSEELATRVEPLPVVEEAVSLPAGKVTEVSIEPVEKPLEALEKPYLTELLRMGEAYNHFDMTALTKEIDSFVKSEIERQGMAEGRASYEEIVNSYIDRLKLPDNLSIYAKTEKLAGLMRINCILLETIKEKEDFLKLDPLTMSSSQLKRYITGSL